MFFSYYKCEVDNFQKYLKEEELSDNTIGQYIRDVQIFLDWAGNMTVEKDTVIAYKNELTGKYKVSSVNAKLTAVNRFLHYTGHKEMTVKNLKIQRQIYCSEKKELKRSEYMRLIKTAKKMNNDKLSLLIQTIGSTGIRVSEVRYITTEAVKKVKYRFN